MSESDQGKIACELFDEVKRLQAEIFELNKPRPWLRAEEVREPGKYHHASHNEYYGVILIVFVDTEVWVRALGDYGPDLIGDVAGDDSRFQRIPEPELPKEGES